MAAVPQTRRKYPRIVGAAAKATVRPWGNDQFAAVIDHCSVSWASCGEKTSFERQRPRVAEQKGRRASSKTSIEDLGFEPCPTRISPGALGCHLPEAKAADSRARSDEARRNCARSHKLNIPRAADPFVPQLVIAER
ncbi:MAG: hypothetical protein JWR59_60 [Brevundimonas sp.]|nr:hypothetical protein [Brevundimonas sp.]